MRRIDRRDFLKLSGLDGAVFVSGLAGCASAGMKSAGEDFYFVQLSDTHWGFEGPPNPDAKGALQKAVAASWRTSPTRTSRASPTCRSAP
jgi:hypothetical protein